MKKNKLQIQFQIGTDGQTDDKANVSKKNKQSKQNETDEKSNVIVNQVPRIQNCHGGNNGIPAVIRYSQDIVDQLLYDLRNEINMKLSDDKLEELVANTREKLNQFQNVTYARAVSALPSEEKGQL